MLSSIQVSTILETVRKQETLLRREIILAGGKVPACHRQDLNLWIGVVVEIVTVSVKEKDKDGWKCKCLRFHNAALLCASVHARLAAQYLDTESDLKS